MDRRHALLGLGFAGIASAARAQPASPPGAPTFMTDRFIDAFRRGDLAAMMALHATDAVFLPTVGAFRLIGHEQISGYYRRSFGNSRARNITAGDEHWQMLGNDVALRSAQVRIEVEANDGRVQVTPSRLSVTFRREGDGWLIQQMHSCQQAAPAG